MNNRKLVLGAFWIDGTDKYFFGLRDAKDYQNLHGGDIRGPHGKLIKADPYRDGKKVMEKSSAAENTPISKKKSGGFFSFFKKK